MFSPIFIAEYVKMIDCFLLRTLKIHRKTTTSPPLLAIPLSKPPLKIKPKKLVILPKHKFFQFLLPSYLDKINIFLISRLLIPSHPNKIFKNLPLFHSPSPIQPRYKKIFLSSLLLLPSNLDKKIFLFSLLLLPSNLDTKNLPLFLSPAPLPSR